MLGGWAVRAFRGSPPVAALMADRAAGIVDVSVFPVAGATRDTTRWGPVSRTSQIAAGLSASVAGQAATFAGSAVSGELAGLLIDGAPFVYRAQAGDSAQLVAAALADAVRAARPCWLTGASVTVPGAAALVARTAGTASIVEEWSRQEQEFRISVWAPCPAARDAVCSAVGAALAPTAFLTLADETAGRLRYRSTASRDDDQVASVYRRELIFDVEYPTTTVTQMPVMLFGDLLYDGTNLYA